MNTSWKKNIVFFLTSQTISLFGSSLVQYAITWYITLQTKSGVMMMIAIICGFIPTFIISPFGGVWADRYNRKLIIVIADAAIALTTFVLAILFLMGYKYIWLLFIALAIRGLGQGIQMPAVGAIIPQIVPDKYLMKVNATNSTLQSFLFLVSPMIAATLITFTTIEAIFFIDVITAALAISILILFLPLPKQMVKKASEIASYFHDLADGLNYVRKHHFLKQLFTFCAIFFIMASPSVFLTPLQVARSFGSDAWRLSAIEVAFSLGMMLGGFLMMTWSGFKNRNHTLTLAYFAFGLGSIALGLVPNFWAYLAVMSIIGVFMPIFNTPFTVILQQKVDPEFLGRVFGFLTMLSSIGMPLGILVFGPLADIIKIEWLLIGTGLILALTSFFMLNNRELLEAGRT